MSFTWPYHSRLMACLHGHEVELFRSHRALLTTERNHWLREIDPAWEVWEEVRTDGRKLISPRPIPSQHYEANRRSARIKPEEIRALEETGLRPEYKEEP